MNNRLYPLGLVLLLLAGVSTSCLLYSFRTPSTETTELYLRPGDNARLFARKLRFAGVIENEAVFLLLLRLSGKESRLGVGRYTFPARYGELRVLRDIDDPDFFVSRVRVLLPEGATIAQAAGILQAKVSLDSAGFVDAAADTLFIESLARGRPAMAGLSSLEGFLFPDTYDLFYGETPREAVGMMVKRFFQVWDELGAGDDSLYALLTLASIVEKETGVEDERPLVAAVFVNRLKRQMPLQSNATLGYIIGRQSQWLSWKELETETPYNSYKHKGLPPTPICNPGKASMEAALRPDTSSYLYFVAKGDGSHLFARTLAQHNENLRRVEGLWKQ